jgi:predicted phosphodiesterase
MQLPQYDFPSLSFSPLVTQTFTARVIPLPRTPASRILLLSDTHLGATIPPGVAIPQFLSELAALVAKEQITSVIHLGDLIHGTLFRGAAALGDVLSRFASLGVPVTVIGGNHDRLFCAEFAGAVAPPVRVVQELALCLEVPAAGAAAAQRIFIAHDLGNNYRVRHQLTFAFLHLLKSSYPEVIKDADWLVTGHCHMTFLSAASRVACLGQFSPEIQARAYAVLEVDEGGVALRVRQVLPE